MLLSTLDLLACPACGSYPLGLTILEGSGDQVQTGYLRCECGRFYFVFDGIARLLTEDFAELIDTRLLMESPDSFEPFASLMRTRPRAPLAEWSMADVAYWDTQYGDPQEQKRLLERVALGRPDAGHVLYPRERYLFSQLRPQLKGGVLLDFSCGHAQTIRVLCDPQAVGYTYVGCDLSLPVLLHNQATMAGEFIQCATNWPPFRPTSADAVVMLGALHHLGDQQAVLGRLLSLVKRSGQLALHEVTFKHGGGGSAHNEAIDLRATLATVSERADVRTCKRERAVLRCLLARPLYRPMAKRPWLTRAVIALDDAFAATLGRFSPRLGARAVLILATKRS